MAGRIGPGAPTIPTLAVSQGLPTRLFVLQPFWDVNDFMLMRNLAYRNLVGRVQSKGAIPADYDVRPVSPADDFPTFQGTLTNNYAGDWSILASVITVTDGKILGTGNTALSGQMPQDRYMIFYGTEIQTPGTPAENAWVFKTGANVKQIWQLQDLLGFEWPRALTAQQPIWAPSELITQLVISVSGVAVVDVHFTLWAEPPGTTITAATARA